MTDTAHLTVRSPAVVDFADGREISNDVALAILRLADSDADLAQRIWAEPTPAEETAIRAECPNGIWGR
jgi:hypothetical protein